MLLSTQEIRSAVRSFFKSFADNYLLLAFRQRWGLTKIPTLRTAHELDRRIPFDRKRGSAYSDYAGFILRTVALLFEELEPVHAEGAVCRLFRLFGGCYAKSAAVYRFCLSSTRETGERRGRICIRPNPFAPADLCMPGVQVALIAALFAFVRKELPTSTLPLPEQAALLSEIQRGALAVIESALFVKRHNVHGVAAAFFLLTAGLEADFSSFYAESFINSLFDSESGMENSDIFEIRSYIFNTYHSFLEESKTSAEWQHPLYRWFRDYAEKTGQQDAFHRLELQLDLI